MGAPLFYQSRQSTRGIRLGEDCCFCDSFRLDQHFNALTGILKNKVSLESDVILAYFERVISHVGETLLVAVRAVEQQQTVQVLALFEALLGKRELTTKQGDVSDLFKLFRGVLLLSNLVRFLDSVKLQCQVKLVVLVRSQIKSH